MRRAATMTLPAALWVGEFVLIMALGWELLVMLPVLLGGGS